MGGPYKLKKRGKPMTTIYDAAILLVDDNPDLLTLVTDNLPRQATRPYALPQTAPQHGRPSPRTART